MEIQKLSLSADGAIPFIAALPYAIFCDNKEVVESSYDVVSQMTVYAIGRDYSTCRYDESVGVHFILSSKTDTKKDD